MKNKDLKDFEEMITKKIERIKKITEQKIEKTNDIQKIFKLEYIIANLEDEFKTTFQNINNNIQNKKFELLDDNELDDNEV